MRKKTTQIKIYLIFVILFMYTVTAVAMLRKAYEQAVFAFTFGSAMFVAYEKVLKFKGELPNTMTYSETMRAMRGKCKEASHESKN